MNKTYEDYPKVRSKMNDKWIECAYCHVNESLINGQLDNHAKDCPYRKAQQSLMQSKEEHANFHDWSED
jgi:hypothetical protein